MICQAYLRANDKHRLKIKEWKVNIFHENHNQKKSGVGILISDKTDFEAKAIVKDKEGHYIMTRISIQKEEKIF